MSHYNSYDLFQFRSERLIRAFEMKPASLIRPNMPTVWGRERDAIMVSTGKGMMVWKLVPSTVTNADLQ